MSSNTTERPILFFDGICNLCNKSVRFIVKHDKKGRFMFATLQSRQGQKAVEAVKTPNGTILDSLILYYKGRYFTKSDAALYSASLLNGAWPSLYLFVIVPRFIRNWVYDTIARNRYKWFGKSDSCVIPTPELLSRFLKE